jgi:hypothetical protein
MAANRDKGDITWLSRVEKEELEHVMELTAEKILDALKRRLSFSNE